MPLDPKAMGDMIESLIKTMPIGTFPVSTTVSSTPGADGTAKMSAVSTPAPVFLDPAIAKVIATAVASAVCLQLQSAAMVTGMCPPGMAGGPLVMGKIL